MQDKFACLLHTSEKVTGFPKYFYNSKICINMRNIPVLRVMMVGARGFAEVLVLDSWKAESHFWFDCIHLAFYHNYVGQTLHFP